MDNYEKFRQIIDSHIAGAPKSKHFDEILEMLFSKEEIEVAIHMNFKSKNAESIATGSSIPLTEVEKRLDSMADKAIILRRKEDGKKLYSLLPTVPGIFELSLAKKKEAPMQQKLAQLWDRYNEEAMIESLCGKPTSHMRVIPIEKAISTQSRILPYEEVSKLINNSKYLAVFDCACRTSAGNCDAPINVCLVFGIVAKFIVDNGDAVELTYEEAMNVLDRTEKAGLVHTSNNSADKPDIICSCCSCCCHAMRGITEFHNPNALATSSYEAMVNHDDCDACGICSNERCPVNAIEIEDTAFVKSDNCIGCGLCVTGCPSEAIKLIKRKEPPETPNTVQDMALKIASEKGKLDKLMKLMT
ncbi:MAG: hypothetical protein C0412_19330 [Flavobacterium sp.]|nr:hypothetical protein [Flavobacterium sp.]